MSATSQRQNAFGVYLNRKLIDTVFYNHGITAGEVRKSLIDHDGYDSRISVISATRNYNGTPKFEEQSHDPSPADPARPFPRKSLPSHSKADHRCNPTQPATAAESFGTAGSNETPTGDTAMKLGEATTTVTLINRDDYQLFGVLSPNLKGGKTLEFRSVWPTSNKKEETKLYQVTLDDSALKRLRLLLS